MSPLAEKIAGLAATGMTAAMIAAEIQYTRNAVVGICHRNGIHLQGNDRKKSARPRVGERQPGQPAPVKNDPPPRATSAGGGCRFIAGDVRVKPVVWCEKPTWPGCSWCPEHHAIVYDRRLAPLV